MDRREFAGVLPAALLSAALSAQAQSLPAGEESEIVSDAYPAFLPPAGFTGRSAHSFFRGMLPTGIGCEVHVSYLAVNAEHEPEEKHRHSELWLIRQGTVELHLNGKTHVLHAGDTGIAVAGTLHYVKNIGDDIASYFVVKIGNGALAR